MLNSIKIEANESDVQWVLRKICLWPLSLHLLIAVDFRYKESVEPPHLLQHNWLV